MPSRSPKVGMRLGRTILISSALGLPSIQRRERKLFTRKLTVWKTCSLRVHAPTVGCCISVDSRRQNMSEAKVTADHNEIRTWVEARGGHPARVKGTEDGGGSGMLRIDYPGYSGEETLETI